MREYEALQARLADERALENRELATAMASRAKPPFPSVRYAVGGGALVMYKQARGTVRITIEGNPGVLCKALERLSLTYNNDGYVMTNSAWAQFLRELGQQLRDDH